MSHFAVIVFGDNIEDQLAPYDENIEAEPYFSEDDGQWILDWGRKEAAKKGIDNPTLEQMAEAISSKDEQYEVRDGKIGHISTYNPEQFGIDICVGKGYSSSRGDGDAQREKMANAGRHEVLPPLWDAKTVAGLLDSTAQPGRKVHLLSGLPANEEQGANPRTSSQVACEGEVRNRVGGICADAGDSEESLRHLRLPRDAEEAFLGGRPRPQDWESARTLVLQMQYDLGPVGGQLGLTTCNRAVPHGPHAIRKHLIGGSKWDWYCVGGRWTGYFPLKPGSKGDVGEPGLMTKPAKAGFADIARLRDIDFDRARLDAAREAHAEFSMWQRIYERNGKPESWSSIRDSGIDIEKARAIYHAQPAIAEAKQARLTFMDCPVELFGFDHVSYVADKMDSVLVPFAFVLDGKWYERGKMGWFACVSDEQDGALWGAHFHKIVSEQDPNTLLTMVDCHI